MKRLFPKIKNVKSFINNDHPKLVPDTDEYDEYWDREEKRCIEGWWVEEVEGSWRYMPPTLYFMINQCLILIDGENVSGRRKGKAFLRDVEWIIHTDWFVCKGFSGFKDGKYSGCDLVKKYWDELNEEKGADGVRIKLTKRDKRKLQELPYIWESEGVVKQYKDPLEILKESYKEPQGLPLYDNENRNYFLLSARSNGKSISMGCCAVHELIFDGQRYFMSELDDGTRGSAEIFVGAPETKKMKNLLGYVKVGVENLYGGYYEDGYDEPPPFAKKWSGSWNKDKGDVFDVYQEYKGGQWVEVRSGTNVAYGTFTVANPDAAVSNRRTTIFLDEVGLAANIEEIHGANVNVLSIFGRKMGSNWYSGTGGNIDKIEGCQRMFYAPRENGFLVCEDIWEGRGEIGRFIPAEYSLQDYKDPNGNTILEEAGEELERERAVLAKADSTLPLLQKKMYMPRKPSEMFVSKNTNLFPIELLQKQLVFANERYDDNVQLGTLEYVGQGRQDVRWQPYMGSERKPIKRMNTDTMINMQGLIEVFEPPPENLPPPTTWNALYKVVYDPVKDDLGGASLASIIVWKGFSSETWEQGQKNFIVAKWIGRYESTYDIHEMAIKLAMYYNAKVFPELDVPEFWKWANKEGLLHFLQPCLRGLENKYGYGLILGQARNSINREGELAVKKLLIEERPNDEGDDGKVYNVNYLYPPRTIEELIAYDRDGNFDDVSALKLLALWLASERGEPVQRDNGEVREVYKQMKGLLSTV